MEASELKGMRKGDVEHLKAFLSRQEDRARMAWGRIAKEVPRQSVLIGTTNSESYLRDGTGNRRFWPVRVSTFDIAALRRDRDQLWAEAAQREAAGESIRLDPKLYPVAAEQQEQRRIEDPFVGTLNAALKDMEGKIKAQDVWRIVDVPAGQRTQEHNSRLGEAMRGLVGSEKSVDSAEPNPNGLIFGATDRSTNSLLLSTRTGRVWWTVGPWCHSNGPLPCPPVPPAVPPLWRGPLFLKSFHAKANISARTPRARRARVFAQSP